MLTFIHILMVYDTLKLVQYSDESKSGSRVYGNKINKIESYVGERESGGRDFVHILVVPAMASR